jgi:uncharacterized membrane protein (DUF106 family)
MWAKILAIFGFFKSFGFLLKSVWEYFVGDKVKIKSLKAKLKRLDNEMHKAAAAGDDMLFNALYSQRMSTKTELDELEADIHK